MGIKRLPSGRFKVTVDVGGREAERRRVVRYADTDEAAHELERFLKRRPAVDGRETVLDAVDRYLAKYGATLEPSTERTYYSTRTTYLATSWLGAVPLDRLDVDELERFYGEVFVGSWRKGAGRKKRGTVVKIHRLLRLALADAKRSRMIPTNPALEARVITPKWALAKPSAADEYDLADISHVLDVAAVEVAELARVARSSGRPADVEAHARRAAAALDLAELVQVALMTGARAGELAGLRWRDVSLALGELVFAGSIGPKRRDEGNGYERKATGRGKLRKAKRLRIDDACVATLEARYRRHVEQAVAAGVDVDDLDRRAVFSLELEVDYCSPAALGARWRRSADRAGVELRFHDLRHVCASEMTAAGVSVTAGTARTGHASNRMYHDVYSHHRADADDPTVAVLAATWSRIEAARKASSS